MYREGTYVHCTVDQDDKKEEEEEEELSQRWRHWWLHLDWAMCDVGTIQAKLKALSPQSSM